MAKKSSSSQTAGAFADATSAIARVLLRGTLQAIVDCPGRNHDARRRRQFRLDDSVEGWLPELANRKVLRRIDSPLDETDAARRSITVRDLLTSIFGFGSV